MRTFAIDMDASTAHGLLANNGVNRRVSQHNINKMARDMLEGRWGINPQPIMVAESGRLIDGQHRLFAVIQAAETKPDIRIPLWIARDVPESAFDVVDQGQPRSSAQTLSIHGFGSSTQVAAAASLVLRYERFPDRIWSATFAPSKTEVIAFVLKNQDEAHLLDSGIHLRHVNMNQSTWMGLQWLIYRHSRLSENWDEFKAGITTGAGLSVGDPRLTLRNRGRVVNDQWGGGQARLGVYIKAWNGFVRDREVKILRFRRDELPMPEIA